MIDLNGDIIKNYFRSLIDIEIANINESLEKQKELSTRVLNCLNNLSGTLSPDMDVDTLSDTSTELVSISKLLNKISYNSASYVELLEQLKNMKQSISVTNNKTINDIMKYNEDFEECIKQISANVEKVEQFIILNNAAVYYNFESSNPINNATVTPVVSVASAPAPVTPIVAKVDAFMEQTEKKKTVKLAQKELPKEVAVNTEAHSEETEELEEEIAKPSLVSEVRSHVKGVGKRLEREPEKKIKKKVEPIIEIPEDELDDLLNEPSGADDMEYYDDLVEDTLIISETDGYVCLPYKICELKEILQENFDIYETIDDVIDECYTVDIKKYKNSSVARFKEAFELVKKRENGSFGEAFSLAMELFSNYNLHPAIITACENLDQLDIYLSCLESNELEDFNFFKIDFRALPAKTKVSPAKILEKGKQLQKGKRIIN